MRRSIILFLLLFSVTSGVTNALEQHEKLWVGVSAQKHLSEDKKWLGFFYTQLRTINESHPWQSGLVEGGLGYQIFQGSSLWVGYRWTAHKLYNDFYQENRLFQQMLWMIQENIHYIILRTRLEEIAMSNQSPVALRLRQRFALEIQKSFWKFFPFYYDEVFFQLNQTNFTPHHFLGENRLFLGFNLHNEKGHWWEIGYINQYRYNTPQNPQNQMSHILSITYNFI